MREKAKKPLDASRSSSNFSASFKWLFFPLAFLSILSLVLGLYLSVRDKGLGSSEAAGWIQALGTIFAIAGSFLIANNQAKENIKSIIKSQELTKDAKRKGILSVVGVAKIHANNIDEVVPEDIPIKIYNVYDKTIINGVVDALAAAPLYEVESPEAIGALLFLRDQFVILGRQVEEYIAGPFNNEHMARTLERLNEPEYKSKLQGTFIFQKQILAKNVKDRIQFIKKQINIIETNLTSK